MSANRLGCQICARALLRCLRSWPTAQTHAAVWRAPWSLSRAFGSTPPEVKQELRGRYARNTTLGMAATCCLLAGTTFRDKLFGSDDGSDDSDDAHSSSVTDDRNSRIRETSTAGLSWQELGEDLLDRWMMAPFTAKVNHRCTFV